jgi:hypothetical protein
MSAELSEKWERLKSVESPYLPEGFEARGNDREGYVVLDTNTGHAIHLPGYETHNRERVPRSFEL